MHIAAMLLSSSDAAKIAFLVAFALGLYALARWSSRAGEESPHQLPFQTAAPSPPLSPESRRPQSQPLLPAEADLRPYVITKFYFATFDLVPGPADPESFADELFVELCDENTGHTWTQSYFVGTPKGMQQLLKDNQWQYAFVDMAFIFSRYNAQDIRRAVVEHIVENREVERPAPPPKPERVG